ncbi:hypothetical protein CLG96_00125 [Sphingomonas oleivorans]|uniref:Bacteriophage tail tape measure N-terminal domain-containing protein n=1 Tax=Sphingomonas oleivorans TaxID=1735121 RepID=A0A2T5G3D8_9SPHN|nr:hypothetical protein [Sphingomonas oleivorans]PTQ13727.1 hypothetical protein CLG96_00125 [Sphingomonas oleivorans]
MAVTADSVVVELEVKLDGYTARVNGAARDFDTNMSSVEKSAARAEAAVRISSNSIAASTAGAAAKSSAVGRQFASIFADIGVQVASGDSPLLILAQQAPRVAIALEGVGGVAGRLATFFAGPWGAALLAAGSVAGVLAEKLLFSGDAAEKTRTNADGLRIAQDGLGDTSLTAANAVDILNKAYANDRTAKIAGDARAVAAERLAQANATFQAARAEGQLRLAQGRARLADLEDGIENNGKVVGRTVRRARGGGSIELRSGGRRLGTQQGRAGSELDQARAAAMRQVADAEGDLARLDQAHNRYSRLAVQRIIATDQAIQDSRLALATAVDDVGRAQERRNMVQREARILLDNGLIDEAEYAKRVRAANKAVEDAQRVALGAAQARRQMASAGEGGAKAEEKPRQKFEDGIKSPGAVAQELGGMNFLEWKNPVEQVTDSFYASQGRDVMAELRATLDAREAGRDAEYKANQKITNDLRDKMEAQVKHVASIYEDLFTGGTDRVWDNFKRQGLQAIALLLARATIASLHGESFLGALQTGLSSASQGGGIMGDIAKIGLSLFGRASGGYVGSGQLVRVNEGASPGNVEGWRPQGSGTVIPLGQMKAARPSSSSTTSISVSVDARNAADPVMTAQLVRQGIFEAAPSIVAAAQGSTMRTLSRPRLPGSNG